MLDETLAERYSEALYQMAREAGEAGQQFRELQKAVELFAEHRELRHALISPAISRDVKKNIIRHLAEGRVQPRTLHFLYLVVDKGREVYLPAILRMYERKLRSDEGIVEAQVEVAFSLDATMEDQIRAHLAELTGKKVQMEVRVRPELIGGAVITVGDRLFDGSVRTHLEKMRERLAQA
jgi:F-type H+-transporting ATPase subunit delta